MNILSNKLDEIKKELQSLIDIIDGLKSYDEIPNIDIDLIKYKMLKSYNNVIDLNNIENFVNVDNNIEIEDSSQPEIEVELIEKADDAPEEAKEFYKNIVAENKQENIVSEIITKEKTEDLITEEVKKEAIEPKETAIIEEEKTKIIEKKIINIDKSIKSPLVNIFESIKNDSNLASKMQFTSISDVKSAISINERIGFISVIFAGDNNKFNNCIDKIDKTNDINTVIAELNEITDWDIENHNHKMFLEIVYRKFID